MPKSPHLQAVKITIVDGNCKSAPRISLHCIRHNAKVDEGADYIELNISRAREPYYMRPGPIRTSRSPKR